MPISKAGKKESLHVMLNVIVFAEQDGMDSRKCGLSTANRPNTTDHVDLSIPHMEKKNRKKLYKG